MPAIADNALVKAAQLIERLVAFRPEPQVQQEVEAFLRAVLGDVPSAGSVLERARGVDPTVAELVEPLLALTLSPTMISASQKRNVIPARLRGHRRLPAAAGPAPARRRADDPRGARRRHRVRPGVPRGAGRDALAARHAAVERGRVLRRRRASPARARFPICCSGFTDSHWLREAFGTVAYGFFPARTMPPELAASLIHSADERVPVADLELGVDWLRHAARALGG